ncbi:hypothetical protein ACEWPL_019370, partial [Roseovarius sp. S1116L3]|uniref:hypothetical protein n=1 Tax=Roseovarius roseus TaxID=3342636 RepID=UPI003B6708F1
MTISLSPCTCTPPFLCLEHQASIPRRRQFPDIKGPEIANAARVLGNFQTAVLGRLRPAVT